MKIPTQPGRMRKAAPRKGRRRKQVAVAIPTIYSLLDCSGCVAGCRPGDECTPVSGYVHGACLNSFLDRAPSIVSGVKEMPARNCLYCNEPLEKESKAP